MNTSATPTYEVGAVVLGYVGLTAAWRRYAPGHGRRGTYGLSLCITEASSIDEGTHAPAQSITITSREGLLALRGAIDEALKECTP